MPACMITPKDLNPDFGPLDGAAAYAILATLGPDVRLARGGVPAHCGGRRTGPGRFSGRSAGEDGIVISVECPACRQGLNIPDEFAGQSGRCNYCGSIVVVPDPTSGVASSSALADLPFATPRHPARPGAGMIANEVEHEGGAGASLGRILLLAFLALAVTACILPALVIGFSAEPAPEEKAGRPRSIPAARGANAPATPAPNAEAPVAELSPAPVPPVPVDEKRIVLTNPEGRTYHKQDCRLAGEGSRATTLRKALDRGLTPCPNCGG